MAIKDTHTIFDEYFETKPKSIRDKTKSQVDRPEVYAYEQRLGKSIFDMDVDELFGLVLSFGNNRKKGDANYSISFGSYDQIASQYRSIWNYYIDNYEVIRNPWNDKRMRGAAAAQRLAGSKKAFTKESLDEIIKRIYSEYDTTRAKYLECILLLFYDGFMWAQEIAALKEDMIDFKAKEIRLPGRTIHLSDRCFELLQYVHSQSSMEGWRGDYLMESYHDGYFKYIIRPKEEKTFQERSLIEIGGIINRRITADINKKFGTDISYRLVYFLGFYDALRKRYGDERAKELIVSVRNSEDASDLMNFAREYGVTIENVSHLKKQLRPFIE